MAAGTYRFLSFVRNGFAGAITQPDTFGPGQAALASAPVGVTVSGFAEPVTRPALVRGPGDVIGIEARQVVRTDPVDGAVGVEPNYFAQVEFDRPDLPWLFTPAAAVGERLRPWIALVVVDLEGSERSTLTDGSPLPWLHVPAGSVGQLPDLASSYLWAHAQVVATDGQPTRDALAGDPRLSVSRLLCPRHLKPFTWYLAAVVPTFEVGRRAGRGEAVTPEAEARLDPAWFPAGESVLPAELPVYHSFRFRTGEEADFESLARKLKGRPLPPGVGTRALDVSRPGAGLPSGQAPADVRDARAISWLDGALRPLGSDAAPERDPDAAGAFRADLTVLLDRPATLVRRGGADPVVAPPIYGGTHALVVELGGGAPPPWITELNLDPRTRIAAGLGTRVVQERQEDLVARAWRQLGDVLAANRLLRAAQLARAGSLRVHERLATLDAATLAGLSAPAHERVAGVAGAAVTVAKAVRDSRLPDVAVETAFRRLTRPSAVAARTAGAATLTGDVVDRFAAQAFVAPVDGPDGVSTMRAASEVIGPAQASAALVAIGDSRPSESGRLDTILATLNEGATALPGGDRVRAGAARTDVGAVALVSALGAVSPSAVLALLDAAAPPAGPRGPLPPRLGDAVQRIVTGSVNVSSLDDDRWAELASAVPVIVASADPVTDPGSRLDAFRRDPAAITALARAAAGQPDAGVALDAVVAAGAGTEIGAAVRASLEDLASGRFTLPLPRVATGVSGREDRAGAADIVAGVAAAFDRLVSIADAPAAPPAPVFDLATARGGLLAKIDPELTVAARVSARLDSRAIAGVPRRDDLDPILACPQFLDPMWEAMRDLGHSWLLPGLELVPPDTATLVRTNPPFVAAHMVGLNHEFMRELLWREYPSDNRGTAFKRFWGRSGDLPDDIGQVHLFAGGLADNLLAGKDAEAVLLLRSELLRRYPGAIVYLCRATQQGEELALDDGTIVLPTFRGDLPPDVSFAGFPITPDVMRAAGDPWWFVIAQPPSEPRFGLDEPTPDTPAVPTSVNELAWSHMAAESGPDAPTPFAPADPPALRNRAIDGLTWGASAAIQAHLTYQHPVRVAIRAADLLTSAPEGPPG